MQPPEIPFVVRIFAPFAMNRQEPWNQPPIRVDLSHPDGAVSAMGISAYFPVEQELCPEGGVEVAVSGITDFHPDAVVQNTPFLNHLFSAGRFLSNGHRTEAEKIKGLEQWPDLPRLDINDEKAGSADVSPGDAGALDEIFDMVEMPEKKQPASSSRASLPGTAAVDKILQAVLGGIFSDKAFRDAEAAWRGVEFLLRQTAGTKRGFQLELVPVTAETLPETIDRLSKNPGRDIPSLIVIDIPFDNTHHRIRLLEKVAEFAETFMAPALVWAAPGLLDLEAWTGLNRLGFLPHYLEAPHFAKFNRLKGSPGANWLAIACNRVLGRHPYGSGNRPKTVSFEEAELPWISPVWALTAVVLKSLAGTGWPTRFTEWQSFRVTDLPLRQSGSNTAIATEVLVSDDRMDQLRRSGLIPIAAMPNRDSVFTPMETTLGGASLAYQLFASRVTQVLLWCREHLPPDLSGKMLEEALKQMFILFWEKSGHPGPESIIISAGPPDAEKRTPLRIDLQPSRDILASGEGLALEFRW